MALKVPTTEITKIFDIPDLTLLSVASSGEFLLVCSNKYNVHHLFMVDREPPHDWKDLTEGEDRVTEGSLSPDDKKLVFPKESRGNEKHNLYITDLGGGKSSLLLHLDSMKTRRSLELANKVLKGEVGRIYVGEVEQSSFLWDGFFDNIFSDLNARDRIIRSRDALGDSLNQTGISIEWIRSRIAETDESLRKLEVKYEGVREKLTNERIRMIRERMSGK